MQLTDVPSSHVFPILRRAIRTLLVFLVGVSPALSFSQQPSWTVRLAVEGLGEQDAALLTEAALQGARELNRVQGGKLDGFATVPDALLYAEYLQSLHGLKATVEVGEGAPSGEPIDVMATIPALFCEKGKTSAEMTLQKLDDPLYTEFKELDVPANRNAYVQRMREARTQLEPTDPVLGYIEMNLGMEELLQGNHSKALLHLAPVANGSVNAAANHRLMALWRIGWIYHQQGDRLKAYCVYKEAQRFGTDDWVKARTGMEIAGILLEFARYPKYDNFKVVRREIDKILATFPGGFQEQRATIELIRLETYYYEGQYTECIPQAEAFLAKYRGEEPKQEATASTFLALSHYYTGDFDKCRLTLESILKMDIPAAERWQTIADFKGHALNWLIILSEKENRQEELARYRQLLRQYEAQTGGQ